MYQLAVGDVVQLSPEKNGCFGGCFAQVTEVKSWGIQGFVCVPGAVHDPPGHAFIRVKWDDFAYIGPAIWLRSTGEECDQ